MPEATYTPDCTPPSVGDNTLSLTAGRPITSPRHPRDGGRPPERECVLLEMPSGRQTPMDGGYAHRHGDRGTYPTDGGRVCVHVTQDGDGPGGEA